MTKIILAEDHNVVRNGIKILLEKEADFEIAFEAANGRQVVEQVKAGLKADVVLTDMNMPVLNGLELLDELKRIDPQICVIILSMLDNESYVIQAFKAGARAYLLKSVSEDELVFAIRHVAAGYRYICSELSVALLGLVSDFSAKTSPELNSAISFSAKELEVLNLIAEGFTNNQIADKLFMSRRTVEGYRQGLLEKTATNNTATLIRYAMRNFIIN